MMTSRPIRDGRPGRAWMRLGLAALSLVALGLEGCASLGIGNRCGTSRCGGFLSRCNLREKLFQRRPAVTAVDSCDPGLGAVPIEGGEVGTFGPAPVLTAPPAESEPNILPNNPASGSPAGTGASGSTGANSNAVKSNYQARGNGRRGEAKEARRVPGPKDVAAGSALDPLADLPNLNVPAEIGPPETSPPVSPSAGDRPSAGVPPAANELPGPSEPIPTGLTPGIKKFKVFDQQLAAGSLPDEAGWKWLVELGYKTVLDLRETSEIKQGELAEIDHYGFRYLALPTSKIAIDEARVKGFEEAIARESRPIFVFDDNGARPASLAFLHLVLTKKTERGVAERQLEELGANDTPLWQATQGFLARKSPSTADGASKSSPFTLLGRLGTPIN